MADADHTSCAHCGAPIKQPTKRSGRRRKFCSSKCCMRHKRASAGNIIVDRERCGACRVCGNVFEQKHTGSKKRYCSKKCLNRARYLRSGYVYVKKQPVCTCRECGVLFLRLPGRGYAYCSEYCTPVKDRRWLKQTMSVCSCVRCGNPFIPIQSRTFARFCSDKCRNAGDGEDATCGYCGGAFLSRKDSFSKYCSLACSHEGRKLETEQQRPERLKAALDDWLESHQGEHSPIEWRRCVCCETETLPPRTTYATTWAGGFCGKCKDALGSAIHSNAGRIDFLRKRLKGIPCGACSKIFSPYNEDQKYCSADCLSRAPETISRLKEERARWRKSPNGKAQKRIANRRRKARKRGVENIERFDSISVFRRDLWICYICGEKTPIQFMGEVSEPKAPTEDHIVPISEGGPHTFENVACACRKCNSIKGNRSLVLTMARIANGP